MWRSELANARRNRASLSRRVGKREKEGEREGEQAFIERGSQRRRDFAICVLRRCKNSLCVLCCRLIYRSLI